MPNQWEVEKRRWEAEVDTRAAELIRLGYAPYDAMEKARDDICRWRREGRGSPVPHPLAK